ncbi:MAG: hypothetical protein ACE14T_04450 [Syntrophales bacterium]
MKPDRDGKLRFKDLIDIKSENPEEAKVSLPELQSREKNHERRFPAEGDRIFDLTDVVEELPGEIKVSGLNEVVQKMVSEIAERVAREMVPEIAERVIREEIEKLKNTEGL